MTTPVTRPHSFLHCALLAVALGAVAWVLASGWPAALWAILQPDAYSLAEAMIGEFWGLVRHLTLPDAMSGAWFGMVVATIVFLACRAHGIACQMGVPGTEGPHASGKTVSQAKNEAGAQAPSKSSPQSRAADVAHTHAAQATGRQAAVLALVSLPAMGLLGMMMPEGASLFLRAWFAIAVVASVLITWLMMTVWVGANASGQAYSHAPEILDN